jgi:hypothetical protein
MEAESNECAYRALSRYLTIQVSCYSNSGKLVCLMLHCLMSEGFQSGCY